VLLNPMSDKLAIINPVIRRLRANEFAIGMLIRLARSGDVVRIAKSAGHDFVFLDIQHALYSRETIAAMAQVAIGCGVSLLVRVRSCRDPDIATMLDCGATGIVVPDVNTAEEAREAVRVCKFAPVGRRSLMTGYPIFDYKPMPAAEAVSILNANTLLVCMLETREGIANAEEIAAVPGVDVVFVGMTDLLADIGKPGQFGDPEVMQATEKVIRAAQQNGKHSGAGGDPDPVRRLEFIRQGARFLTLNSDSSYLMAAATSAARELRAATPSK
jgi:2-keto-3-deoxy-L-rhamnonate aldolase RhmA